MRYMDGFFLFENTYDRIWNGNLKLILIGNVWFAKGIPSRVPWPFGMFLKCLKNATRPRAGIKSLWHSIKIVKILLRRKLSLMIGLCKDDIRLRWNIIMYVNICDLHIKFVGWLRDPRDVLYYWRPKTIFRRLAYPATLK